MNNISILKFIELEVNRQEQDKLAKEHRLTQLFWECTVKCNQNCLHCGGDCRKMDEVSDMPIESFITVLDNIASNQDPAETIIIICGGEPLLRPDLEICGKEIHKRGFKWGILTNGELLTQEKFDQVCDSGMQSITISLD
ncbi:MAG: radical SAM protein, partial [Bacteroidaceae bacterium]|nr:radical SAM protein [Bacteroidaceae bacterium]